MDYPDLAAAAARAVAEGKAQRAIVVDGVGIGSAMAANKVPGILAAMCTNAFEARNARVHNFANVMTLGGRTLGIEIAKQCVKIFLETASGEERHRRRVEKILALEGQSKA